MRRTVIDRIRFHFTNLKSRGLTYKIIVYLCKNRLIICFFPPWFTSTRRTATKSSIVWSKAWNLVDYRFSYCSVAARMSRASVGVRTVWLVSAGIYIYIYKWADVCCTCGRNRSDAITFLDSSWSSGTCWPWSYRRRCSFCACECWRTLDVRIAVYTQPLLIMICYVLHKLIIFSWKDPNNPFRTDPRTKLVWVPTLLNWRTSERVDSRHVSDPLLVNQLLLKREVTTE